MVDNTPKYIQCRNCCPRYLQFKNQLIDSLNGLRTEMGMTKEENIGWLHAINEIESIVKELCDND